MAFHNLLLFVFISMIFIYSIKSSPMIDDFIFENDVKTNPSTKPSIIINSIDFISYICQKQEQYPKKMTKKLCANFFQSNKIQEQQRDKRVGWTISV